MDSFLVAARVVVPMAMMMAVGWLLRVTKITDRDTMRKVDKITYHLFMPLLMFYNIYNTDFTQMGSPRFIAYGMAGLTVLFLVALFLVPRVEKNPPTAAALGQAVLRPNYILFGVAVAESLYGSEGTAVLMLMGAVAVPVFNAMSAIVLEAGRAGKAGPGRLLLSVFKNPMVIGALLGLAVNFSGLRFPDLVEGVIGDLAGLTTPISFLSLGVSLSFAVNKAKSRSLAIGMVSRLVVTPLIFVIGAVLLGFRRQELCALLILFAAPTAVSSYPMAVAMDADGELAGQMVALTTLFSLGTLFIWTLVLNSAGLL